MNIDKLSDQEKSVLLARAMEWKIIHKPTEWEVGHYSRGYYAIHDENDNRIPLRVLFEAGENYYSHPYPKMPELEDFSVLNLFDTDEMALAWRVLNWAANRNDRIDDYSYPYTIAQGAESLFSIDYEIEEQIWAWEPANAQRLWLDKILELAIEAELVEVPA